MFRSSHQFLCFLLSMTPVTACTRCPVRWQSKVPSFGGCTWYTQLSWYTASRPSSLAVLIMWLLKLDPPTTPNTCSASASDGHAWQSCLC